MMNGYKKLHINKPRRVRAMFRRERETKYNKNYLIKIDETGFNKGTYLLCPFLIFPLLDSLKLKITFFDKEYVKITFEYTR